MSSVPSIRVPARPPVSNPPRRTPVPQFKPIPPKAVTALPTPPAPMPSRQKPRASQSAGASRSRATARTESASTEPSAARSAMNEAANSANLQRALGMDGFADDNGSALQESKAGLPGDEQLDLSLLADEILPHCEDDGIFEVTLPDGQTLGVVVNLQGGRARIHLSASDDKLAGKLRRRQMELQGHLERRMQRNVEITVL